MVLVLEIDDLKYHDLLNLESPIKSLFRQENNSRILNSQSSVSSLRNISFSFFAANLMSISIFGQIYIDKNLNTKNIGDLEFILVKHLLCKACIARHTQLHPTDVSS